MQILVHSPLQFPGMEKSRTQQGHESDKSEASQFAQYLDESVVNDQLILASAVQLFGNVQRVGHERIAGADAELGPVGEHVEAGSECRESLIDRGVVLNIGKVLFPRPEHARND